MNRRHFIDLQSRKMGCRKSCACVLISYTRLLSIRSPSLPGYSPMGSWVGLRTRRSNKVRSGLPKTDQLTCFLTNLLRRASSDHPTRVDVPEQHVTCSHDFFASCASVL